MKMTGRKSLILAVVLLVGFVIGVQAQQTGAPAKPPEKQPEKRVMTYIAVMDLKCGQDVKASLAGPLTNVVIQELLKIGKYTIIDRANRDKILGEQGFQQTGCVSDQCAVEMGRILGVGKLVLGSIDRVGQSYLINLQIVNVQTAAVEAAERETCKCEEEGLIQAVANVTKKLLGQQAASTAAGASTQNICYVVAYSVSKRQKTVQKTVAELRDGGYPAFFIRSDDLPQVISKVKPEDVKTGVFWVCVGPYATDTEATEVSRKIKTRGIRIVKIDNCEALKKLSRAK